MQSPFPLRLAIRRHQTWLSALFTVGNNNPTPRQYFTVNATVNNRGNGPSSSTTLRYYRSTDATITTSDSIIPTAGIPGYLSVEGLSASGSIDRSASTDAPPALGTYYYGACVETVPGESDTTNNCSLSATVTIDRANRPPRLTGDVDDKVVEVGDSFKVDLSGLFTDPEGRRYNQLWLDVQNEWNSFRHRQHKDWNPEPVGQSRRRDHRRC